MILTSIFAKANDFTSEILDDECSVLGPVFYTGLTSGPFEITTAVSVAAVEYNEVSTSSG
jgi:hypothetical protein